LLSCL